MSQAFRLREPTRQKLLARVAMTEALIERLHEDGRLEVCFGSEVPLQWVVSLDGSGAVLQIGASGRPVGLLIYDLVDPEDDRYVYFPSITILLRWRDDELLIHGAPGTGAVDPWAERPIALRSRHR